MTNDTKTPHPHAELIKAWADGARIQVYNKVVEKWLDCTDNQPEWRDSAQYRIKPETVEWKPGVYEFYYSATELCTVSEYKCIDDGLDSRRIAIGNCFKTREEAEAAAERVKAALKGKESEELKKLREENEELKKKVAPVHGKTTIEEETSCSARACYRCHAILSDGEAALIRALRQTMIVCAWGHNEVAIVDKELKTRHDCVSFLTTGSLASDDKIRDALNAISREQDAAIEQAEQEDKDE